MTDDALFLLSRTDREFFRSLFASARLVVAEAEAVRAGGPSRAAERSIVELRAATVQAKRPEWQARFLSVQRAPGGARASKALGPLIVERLCVIGEIAGGTYFDPPSRRATSHHVSTRRYG